MAEQVKISCFLPVQQKVATEELAAKESERLGRRVSMSEVIQQALKTHLARRAKRQ